MDQIDSTSRELREIRGEMEISWKHGRWMALAGVILVVVCMVCPVHSRLLQAGSFIGVILAAFGVLPRLGRRVVLPVGLLATLGIGAIPLLMPGKPIDHERLRSEYVEGLRRFEGCRYVWGGESSLGIDCSGLPRRALRDALLSEGCSHANGDAFRMWLEQWWHDSSALAIREGYRGFTRPLGLSGPLWEMDQHELLPGDLAVRGDGRHVVVYLGDHWWIEADPHVGKVHKWKSTAKDGRLYQEMTLHRWMICDDG
jgi:hypothetical protein